MAQFIGTVEGTRGPASRLGSKRTGLTVTANGWDLGITVELRHIDGKDVATVFLTGGSNDPKQSRLVGEFTEGGLIHESVVSGGSQHA